MKTEGQHIGTLKVAITGGIGSGKSVVSRVLMKLGFPVYDCDSRAKRLMDCSAKIKRELAERIDESVILPDGAINRPRLAEIVFADAGKLASLNAIVHSAVRQDISEWVARHSDAQAVFIETAILYQSGLDGMVDVVLEVEAEEAVRVARVCKRNGLQPEQVKARIESQKLDGYTRHPRICTIDNSGETALIPQIFNFLKINDITYQS